MPAGKKRMTIQGLVPGEEYVIQVRAVDEGEPSVWSPKEKVTTIDDTAGGTRTPVTVSLTSFDISADGTFTATWPTVNANTDGTELVVKYYEFRLQSPFGEKLAQHYGSAGATQTRQWTLGQMKALWGGTLPATITASIRVVNSAGTPSAEWSNEITVALPTPYPPTEVVPEVESIIDGVKAMWGPPAEPYVPGDPRWPAGYRVYFSIGDPNFVPDVAQKSNMYYQGTNLSAAMTSLSYETDHWFKVCSYSLTDLQSEYIEVGPVRPKSPYGPDTQPPLIPSITSLTLNSDRSVSGQANLTWSINETAEENEDIAGFVVAWKLTSDTLWRNNYFDKTARAGVVELPRAFGNYDFKIAAYDFVGNYSDYSVPQTLTGAGDPPAALTGVDAVARWDGMRLFWNASESQAVKNGGKYEVQFKSTNSFTDNVPTYTTGNTELEVSGLSTPLGTYYYRVRAVDVIGRAGPWSSVVSKTLPAFPSTSTSDGNPPAAAPQNVRVAGGLNYLNVSWDRVVNTDFVVYEVYMSTTSGFTPGASNFVGSTPAQSLMVNNLNGGVALAQSTTYYVKVVATDADTKQESHKVYSAQASGQLTQVAAGDLGINMSGENLLYNTSFEEDSNADNVANYWSVYNNSPGPEPTTPSLPNTGRTGGKSQKVTWTGVNTTQKGIFPNTTQQVTKPNTEYTLSFYARAGSATNTQAGTGFSVGYNTQPASSLWISNPTPSPTTWNRYIYKFVTGATVDANNFFVSIVGHTTNGGWVEFDDIQLEAGNIASAYKVGTVSIAKLASGTMETAVMTIASGGQIKSADYNFAAKTGFLITGTGINLLGGTVNAATLQSGTTITNDLYIGNKLEVASNGYIQNALYATSAGTQGYRISQNSIHIASGTVAAGTLAAGTITSPNIILGAGGKITVDATGSIVSNNYSDGVSGFKISNLGIEMWDTNSKINVAALETGTLSSAIITIGSGGEIASANWNATAKTGWKLNETGFTMYNGTIEGATVRTNQIYSLTNDAVSGKPTFSINAQGYAEIAGALVHGNMRVADAATNVVQSANYNGNGVGWQIRGDGLATFFNVQTWNLAVYAAATVGASAAHFIQSANYSPNASGWRIRGDGYAEFNGGDMRLGASDGSGGLTWLMNSQGNGQIRFYVPGDFGHFHYLRSVGQEFWLQGGWGGYIHIAPDNTVYMSQNVYVSSNISGGTITSRNNLSGNGLDINTSANIGGRLKAGTVDTPYIDGDPRFVGRDGGGFVNAMLNSDGQLRRQSSSRRYKHDIQPLAVDTAKVLQLEPKTFKYNDPTAGDIRYPGFIAEDAQDLGLTDFVIYETIDNQKVPAGFRYAEYVAALVLVIKDQKQQLDALATRVASLESRS